MHTNIYTIQIGKYVLISYTQEWKYMLSNDVFAVLRNSLTI